MLYKLLGMIVWWAAKLVVRRRVAGVGAPARAAALGAALAAVLGVVWASSRAKTD